MTPKAVFDAVMPGRACCVSFFRPDNVSAAEAACPFMMYDNGAFSEWQRAVKFGNEWFVRQNWQPYYEWLENRIFYPGRWAVIPDAPGAPSQFNDGLLNDWPFGRTKGSPLWHMDAPIDRLGRLLDKYERVCIGWVGDTKKEPVGCDAYHEKMEEVSRFLGNKWPILHMMRGVAVARLYPFASADSTSLAQNGHKYDDHKKNLLFYPQKKYEGRNLYADRLENGIFSRNVLSRVSKNNGSKGQEKMSQYDGCSGDERAGQIRLW